MANVAARGGAAIGNMLAGGGIPQKHPVDIMHTLTQTASTMQQMQLQARRIQAMQAWGDISASSSSLDEAVQAYAKTPHASFIPDVVQSLMTTNRTAQEMSKERTEMSNNAMGNFTNSMSELLSMTDPSSPATMEDIKAKAAELKQRQLDVQEIPSVRDRLGKNIDSFYKGILDGAGGDKSKVHKDLHAALIHSGVDAAKLAYGAGKPEALSLGSQVLTGVAPGAVSGQWGAFQPAGRFDIGAAPQWTHLGQVPVAAPAIPGGAGQPPPSPGTLMTPGGPGGAPVPAPGGAPAPTTAPAPGPPPLPKVDVPSQALRQAGWAEKSIENISAHSKDLDEKIAGGAMLGKQIQEARELMKIVQVDPQQAWRHDAARLLAMAGGRKDLVDKMAMGGQGAFAAAQELQKIFVQSTMSQLRQQIPPGSRLNLMEWQAFLQANPRLDMDVNAVDRIFDFWQGQYHANVAESRALADYLSEGNDPAKWASEWAKIGMERGVYKVTPSGQARGATPPKPSTEKLLEGLR